MNVERQSEAGRFALCCALTGVVPVTLLGLPADKVDCPE